MKRALALGGIGLVCLVTAVRPSGAARTDVLSLNAEFGFHWETSTTCPSGVDPTVSACLPQTAQTVIRGLGAVSLANLAVITETPLSSGCWLWQMSGALSVAGKGTIDFTATDLTCQQQATATLPYTITGGSGSYVGATGSGTLAIPSFNEGTKTGLQRWTGTLEVPGLTFDMSPPTLSGLKNRTVRAKSKRGASVRYAVTARDAVDGSVPATCKPRSGSVFRVGKTIVNCTASDRSGNRAAGAFRVTVKR